MLLWNELNLNWHELREMKERDEEQHAGVFWAVKWSRVTTLYHDWQLTGWLTEWQLKLIYVVLSIDLRISLSFIVSSFSLSFYCCLLSHSVRFCPFLNLSLTLCLSVCVCSLTLFSVITSLYRLTLFCYSLTPVSFSLSRFHSFPFYPLNGSVFLTVLHLSPLFSFIVFHSFLLSSLSQCTSIIINLSHSFSLSLIL